MKRLSILLVLTLCYAASAAGQTCTPSATVACLLDDRFEVRVAWTNTADNPLTLPAWGLSGDGMATPFGSRTALFSFFTPDSPTMIVKIVDATVVSGNFWVFGSAATNVAFTLTVTDTLTGQIETYDNPQGTIAPGFLDTDSFPTASPSPSQSTSAFLLAAPRASHTPFGPPHPPEPPEPPEPCAAPAHFLHDGRFEVTVCFINQFAGGTAGEGISVPFSESSALVWFFRSDNLELVVNVIDGRTANDHWWVHVASLAAVNWTVTIRDATTGAVWNHTNPPGGIDPVLDAEAFVDGSEIPTLGEWGLGLLVLLLLGSGLLRLRSRRRPT